MFLRSPQPLWYPWGQLYTQNNKSLSPGGQHAKTMSPQRENISISAVFHSTPLRLVCHEQCASVVVACCSLFAVRCLVIYHLHEPKTPTVIKFTVYRSLDPVFCCQPGHPPSLVATTPRERVQASPGVLCPSLRMCLLVDAVEIDKAVETRRRWLLSARYAAAGKRATRESVAGVP